MVYLSSCFGLRHPEAISTLCVLAFRRGDYLRYEDTAIDKPEFCGASESARMPDERGQLLTGLYSYGTTRRKTSVRIIMPVSATVTHRLRAGVTR